MLYSDAFEQGRTWLLMTDEEISGLPFLAVQKTAPVRARILTEEDLIACNGIIQSREGAVKFQPGDYLARGIQDEEWPISKRYFETKYECISGPDLDGFTCYKTQKPCQACQISHPFAVNMQRGDILMGKAGDYLVRSGGRVWIVDREIFEQSYERL